MINLKIYKDSKLNSGFTLVELLIAITVIGLLATVTLISINPGLQMAKGRDAKRKNDLRIIKQALEDYYIANGHYPITGGYCCEYWVHSNSGGSPWIPGLDSAYLKILPRDPKNNNCCPWDDDDRHTYAYSSNGKHFNLVSKLENAGDPDRCELKQWFWVQNDAGAGVSWCGTYTKRIYALTDK